MKRFLFLLAFLLSLPSWALTGSRNFEVQNAQFDPLHNLNASAPAQMIVDYDHETVTLLVARPMPVCPEGMFCAQMMPAPFMTELPIVDVHTDACGVRQVTAEQDQRPLDGAFEKIQLSDASDMFCRYLPIVSEKATYETEYFSDTLNKTIKTWSTMNLKFESQGVE